MGSLAPVAFVGVDGAVVRHNTFYRPEKWVMRILQESRDPLFVPCRNGSFENNLIVFRSSEVQVLVNVGSGTLPDSFRFSGNHWFCEDRPERSQPRGLPTTESHGTHGVNPRLRNPAALDVRISPGALGREVGARSAVWKE